MAEERGSLKGTEDFRNQQLQDVLETLNKAIKRRERRKRKLIKEAMRLQKEAEMQVGLIYEIQRMEENIRAARPQSSSRLERETRSIESVQREKTLVKTKDPTPREVTPTLVQRHQTIGPPRKSLTTHRPLQSKPLSLPSIPVTTQSRNL